MGPMRGRVQNGKIIVDDPVDLPDGTEVQLTVVDEGDDLDDEERARLHAAIDAAEDEIDAGLGIPADEFLADLAASRSK